MKLTPGVKKVQKYCRHLSDKPWSRMLRILDLISLARLAGCERLKYESDAQ